MPLQLVTSPLEAVLLFVTGVLVGLGAAALVQRRRARLVALALDAGEERRQSETEALLDGVKLAFGDISLDSMRRTGEDLMRQMQAALGAERRLQGQQLGAERAEFESRIASVLTQIERLQGLIRDVERERAQRMGELGAQVKLAFDRAARLAETTAQLREALVSGRARGQLGERLAEDLLRRMGLVENVHWKRQTTLPNGSRPDVSFLLPDGQALHMDVKFPLDNWLRVQDAADDEARTRARAAFVRDSRIRIAEVATRGYVDAAAGTLPFALLLIANDQVFAALLEAAPEALDEAFAKGVLVCSPVGLFAVLALIREAGRHLRLERAGAELGAALAGFREQWQAYQGQLDRLGKRLEETLGEYHELRGRRSMPLLRAAARLDALDSAVEPPPERPDPT